MTHNAYEELKWRGFVYDNTEEAPEVLAKQKITIYNGFDPTGDSLHIGHLVPMMALARLQRFGHTPIALAGGGTGMVGDPSGRSDERNLLTRAEVEANLVNIQQQLAGVLDFEVKSNPARIMNNADWLLQLNLLEFLRDVGKHFTVNYMMAKDSVRSRLAREDGISYTEFSYMLLQAYDFMHLFTHHQCVMQMGGSDQWGNIVAGVELIRKVQGARAHALVFPLITQADGTKFGKTAAGTNAWLSAERTSPYRFYQFWYNTNDADVVNYLKYFTWRDQHEIAELENAVFERPEQREAQRRLAQDVTRMVHGDTAVHKAEKATAVLFGGDLEGLDASDIRDIFANVPSSEIARADLGGDGLPVVDLLVHSGLASSKGDGRRAIQGGGIYLNNQRVEDPAQMVTADQSIDGQFLILRKGRKAYHLVKFLR
ncbi:MAG: tyrosine--tRNA ligase [Chloroflexi bacterium]|nr:tyrosine--tRNA ligase [Ardenticatenaceae bacterium]MBL1131552.1 tyrosine--tRNA ligase [Chloroflexota bacterium]NOG37664.1 tyrosine--tRNA ligase [Chloroflexota bacterium]